MFATPFASAPANRAAALALAYDSSVDYGGYACIRANLGYVFPQTTNAGITAIEQGTNSPIQTFWQTTTAKLGNHATNKNYDCCLNMDTNANCPGLAASGTNAYITGRVFFKGSVAGVPASATESKFKDDFVLASLYQNSFSGTGTRATEKCDVMHNTLAAVTDTKDLTSKLLTYRTKCSYFISTTAATFAPAIELKTLGSWAPKWQFQWVEWDKTAMTTGAFLPAASAASAWLGTYDVSLPWPNPIYSGN